MRYPSISSFSSSICYTNIQHPYSFERLEALIENPKKGRKIYFRHLRLGQLEDNPIKPGCWLVMRKKLLCRNLTYAQQVQYIQNVNERTHAGYEEELTAIDIATIVLAHHVLTGERYLGDFTGAESHPTYSCCKDSVKCDERVYPLIIGNFAIDNLNINHCNPLDNGYRFGTVAVRKFSNGNGFKE